MDLEFLGFKKVSGKFLVPKTIEQVKEIREKICNNIEYFRELIALLDDIRSSMYASEKIINLTKQLEKKINK